MWQNRVLWKITVCVTVITTFCPQARLALAEACNEKCTGGAPWGDWTGAGDGACGVCENKVKTRSLGSCTATNENEACSETHTFERWTEEYSCHPPGTLGLLACWTLAAGCGLVGLGVCAGVCFTAGVWTGGAACYACLAGLVVGGGVCGCLVAECLCPCEWDRTTYSDYRDGCIVWT